MNNLTRRQIIEKTKHLVVKVGTNVLTTQAGLLNQDRIHHLVEEICEIRKRGIDVILVSSGAMASGRGELKVDHDLDSVEQRQLFSALGQAKLIGLYYDLFREYGMHVGQVLTMKENFQPGEQYENQKACMTVMLENDVIPIVNENDTVSVTELMFTDNDELSGLIARIDHVAPGTDLSQYIQPEKSAFGRGGMHSKYTTASKIQSAGIQVIIANGERDNILIDLVVNPNTTPHTEFNV